MDRRDFLARAGLAVAAGAGAAAFLEREAAGEESIPFGADWATVRRQFALDRDWTHLGGLLLASHPAPVRSAIQRHRRRLDANPVHYLRENGPRQNDAVRGAAARYLGGSGPRSPSRTRPRWASAWSTTGSPSAPGRSF